MKGHWYTDKNGNHYFVENGQSPKEGWEQSKRRKMINGGKFSVSEDGDNWKDVSEDEYKEYEADESDFDENIEDDFGEFDEEYEDEAGSPYKEIDEQWVKDHIEDNPDMSSKDLMENITERFGELSPDDEQYVKQLLKNREIDAKAVDTRTQESKDVEGHDYELDALRERDESGLNNDNGWEPQSMDDMIENAFKNGQTPQQVVDSVKYDMDIEDGSPELKELMDKVKNYSGNKSENESGNNKELNAQIAWCKSALNNPNGRQAMDAKANYGKNWKKYVQADLKRFENMKNGPQNTTARETPPYDPSKHGGFNGGWLKPSEISEESNRYNLTLLSNPNDFKNNIRRFSKELNSTDEKKRNRAQKNIDNLMDNFVADFEEALNNEGLDINKTLDYFQNMRDGIYDAVENSNLYKNYNAQFEKLKNSPDVIRRANKNKTMNNFKTDDEYFEWFSKLSPEEQKKHLWDNRK